MTTLGNYRSQFPLLVNWPSRLGGLRLFLTTTNLTLPFSIPRLHDQNQTKSHIVCGYDAIISGGRSESGVVVEVMVGG